MARRKEWKEGRSVVWLKYYVMQARKLTTINYDNCMTTTMITIMIMILIMTKVIIINN
jgi:hypothetical protein